MKLLCSVLVSWILAATSTFAQGEWGTPEGEDYCNDPTILCGQGAPSSIFKEGWDYKEGGSGYALGCAVGWAMGYDVCGEYEEAPTGSGGTTTNNTPTEGGGETQDGGNTTDGNTSDNTGNTSNSGNTSEGTEGNAPSGGGASGTGGMEPTPMTAGAGNALQQAIQGATTSNVMVTGLKKNQQLGLRRVLNPINKGKIIRYAQIGRNMFVRTQLLGKAERDRSDKQEYEAALRIEMIQGKGKNAKVIKTIGVVLRSQPGSWQFIVKADT